MGVRAGPEATHRGSWLLSIAGVPRLPMSPSTSANSTPAPHTLFAVDDDENDRSILARCVAEAAGDCVCRTFAAGEDLLDALIDVLRGAPAPLACFVDVKMHGMSGLDVLRWIRAQRALDGVAVVMLSSSDHPSYLAEALQFGAQCYATKFPGPAELRDILAEASRHAEASECRAFQLPCNLLLAARAPTASVSAPA